MEKSAHICSLCAVLENNKFLSEFFHLPSSVKREVEKKTRKVSFNFVEFSYLVKSTWRFMSDVRYEMTQWSRQKLVTCNKIKYPSYRWQSVVKFTLNCSSQLALFLGIRRRCLSRRSQLRSHLLYLILNLREFCDMIHRKLNFSFSYCYTILV